MLADLTPAIGEKEFDELLRPFSPITDKIGVAVSGGPDSMALAYCVSRWRHNNVIAFIVDHKLRPNSTEEALETRSSLERIGLESKILTWQHEDVSQRLHERARHARYNLLFEACRAEGINDLMLGHQKEDQAETILMRIAKGSGVEGLAGMALQTWRKDIRLLRPFLPIAKERLIATCEHAHLPFIADPSNLSEKYARGRLRRMLPLLEREGLSIENLAMLGVRAAEANDALAYYTNVFLKAYARQEIGGSLTIDRTALTRAPRAIGLRALSLSLNYVHASDHPPEYVALSEVLTKAIETPSETTRSLCGCLVSIAPTKIFVLREPVAVTERIDLSPGQSLLWDNRWIVSSSTESPGACVCQLRALGIQKHDLLDRLAPNLRRAIPQGRVRASLPSLWVGDYIRAIPSFDGAGSFHMVFSKQIFP